MTIQTVNPATGEVVKTYTEATPQQIETVLQNAAAAFPVWRDTSIAQRGAALAKVADIIEQRAEKLAQVITLEMGKLIKQSRAEINLTVNILRYYASQGEALLADTPLNSPMGQAYAKHQPLGVILGIEPWNYPFYQMVRMAAPNLVAGNTVVMKQASNVPLCSIEFEQAFIDAGFAPGVYTNLLLSGSKTSGLVADVRVAGVSLTGSEKAGATVASTAATNLKKSVMELGGSDAMIVLDDVDPLSAAKMVLAARMENMGQTCTSSKRIIVLRSVADQIIQGVAAGLSQLQVGDPKDEATTLAPVSSESALETLLDQVSRAVAGGATLVQGGTRIDRTGAYMQPALITNMNPGNPVYYEEIFGPVVVFYVVDTEDEAIAIANDSHFGLGGSVLANDTDRAQRVAQRMDTGMVYINTPTISMPSLPFGGVKRSGYGRELSSDGALAFTNKKLVHIRPAMGKV